MNLKNNTKNQHFIPQVEQKLNAIDPLAPKSKRLIYSFSVKDLMDRENYKISLDNKNGMLIHQNLSFKDLFSFDVIGEGNNRFNFEALFQQYESDIDSNTTRLLSKLDCGCVDVQTEVKNIYNAKFLNFLRNPYSIEKMVNTIGNLNSYYPADSEIYATYNAVRAGRKPQQEDLCAELGILDEVYDKWLLALFMLLHEFKDGLPNIMEMSNNTLFTDPLYFVSVIVYKYENEHCLLSDRGFSIPLPENDYTSFDFNLCSNSFIRYIFVNLDKHPPKEVPGDVLKAYKGRPRLIDMGYIKNDLDELLIYNQNVIDQCHSKVYGSADEYHGVQVV